MLLILIAALCVLLFWIGFQYYAHKKNGHSFCRYIKTSSPEKPWEGQSWNFTEKLTALASTNMAFFIPVALTLSLLWQLNVSIDIMGKVKIGLFCYITMDILTNNFTEMFLEESSTKHHFCHNLWIWLVTVATERLDLRKIFTNHLPGDTGDKAENFEKCL